GLGASRGRGARLNGRGPPRDDAAREGSPRGPEVREAFRARSPPEGAPVRRGSRGAVRHRLPSQIGTIEWRRRAGELSGRAPGTEGRNTHFHGRDERRIHSRVVAEEPSRTDRLG